MKQHALIGGPGACRAQLEAFNCNNSLYSLIPLCNLLWADVKDSRIWDRLADAAIMLGNVGAAPAWGNQNLPQPAPACDSSSWLYLRSWKRRANAAQFLLISSSGMLALMARHVLSGTWWQRNCR